MGKAGRTSHLDLRLQDSPPDLIRERQCPVFALAGPYDLRLERELRRQVGGVITPGPGGLLGLELEFSVRSGQGGRVHFGSLIHRLALDGSTLDPGDRNAYRCSWGGVITSDGAEAEIATPPVPTRPGFASQILSWAETGEAELRRAVPAGIELTGYSAHFSAAMPARLNEPVCRLYAETFAAGLMLLMERADSPGLLIRPRPGRTELCGEFVAGESLPAVAAFVAGSTRACAAAVSRRSAGRLLPPDLEVRLAPAVRRYGWYVDRAAFGTDLHAASRQTLLPRASGGTISAQSHLELAWAAARQALAEAAADTDVRTADAMVTGSLPLPGEDRPPFFPDRREPGDGVRPGPGYRAGRETPVLLGPRTRPGFALRPVAATWDFTVFAANGPGRTAYVCVPRDSLPSFLGRLEDGALDDAIEEHLARPARRQVLSAHRQTGHLGVYDRMGAPAKLLAPERDPQTGRRESAQRPAKYAFTRPGKPRRRDDPPDRPGTGPGDSPDRARPRFTRRALLAATVLAALVVGAAAAAVALGRPSGPPPVPAPLSFQPSALSFPDVAVNSSTTKDLTITDTSRSPLTVGQLRISGPDPSNFSILAQDQDSSAGHVGQAIRPAAAHPLACPRPLQPARTCTIAMRFAPSQAGKSTADLLIYLTSRAQPWTVTVTGTGTTGNPGPGPSPSRSGGATSPLPHQASISGVAPSSGLAAGGTPVTITGNGFAAGATVDFGPAPATNVTVVSDTEITADSPAGAGTVDVSVTVGSLSSTAAGPDQFTYQPDVSGVAPSSGLAAGGTLVTITGNGFAASATVDFGPAPATNVTVVSDTEITAVSPAGAGTVDASVTVGSLTLPATGTSQFSYQPTITVIHPRLGSHTDNTNVFIFGTGFTPGATVMFGSNPGVLVEFISSTEIEVASPTVSAVGVVRVEVTVGTLSSAPNDPNDLFDYT